MKRGTLVMTTSAILIMAACRPDAVVDKRIEQELSNERVRRVQAEQKAAENEKRTGTWQNAAIIAGLGGVVLLVVGAGLGSMGKRDAG